MYVCVYVYVCRCCVCIQVLCLQLLFLFFPHWLAAGDSCENGVSHTLLVMLGHGCRPLMPVFPEWSFPCRAAFSFSHIYDAFLVTFRQYLNWHGNGSLTRPLTMTFP